MHKDGSDVELAGERAEYPEAVTAEIEMFRSHPFATRAAVWYEEELKRYTEAEHPTQWAELQRQLGVANITLFSGSDEAFLYRAIECFQSALRVYTEANYPYQWARVQSNMGEAYLNLYRGDKVAAVNRALACFHAALRIYTEDRYPQEWARTQNHIGEATTRMPGGDREAAWRERMAYHEAALRVCSEEKHTRVWAETQYQLGDVYGNLEVPKSSPKYYEYNRNARDHYANAGRGYSATGQPDMAAVCKFWVDDYGANVKQYEKKRKLAKTKATKNGAVAPSVKYHKAILELLDIEPVISPGALAVMEQREAECGVTFPASVKEWFSLEGVSELFEAHTTPDYLVEVAELGNPAEVAQGYLHVASENQAVVLWFVKLDGSDDPPVVNDDNQYHSFDFSEIGWQFTSASFSDFIFRALSYGYFGGPDHRVELTAIDQAPDAALLKHLRKRYREGPRTERPDCRTYRFFNQHGLISIENITDDAGTTTRWTVEADSTQELNELAESIRHYGTLAAMLQPA